MSKHLTITILVILLALLVLPRVASAARFPFEGPLVPCGRCEEWECGKWEKRCPGGEDTCSEAAKVNTCAQRNYDVCINPPPGGVGDPCNLCHFFALAQNVIDGFITIIFFVGTVMVGVGGFMILTAGGVPEKTSHGKKVILYTIIGILVAFLSWMLINEVMLLLVGTGEGAVEEGRMPWPWDKIDCGKEWPRGSEIEYISKLAKIDVH